jgi:hypothetical protein
MEIVFAGINLKQEVVIAGLTLLRVQCVVYDVYVGFAQLRTHGSPMVRTITAATVSSR